MKRPSLPLAVVSTRHKEPDSELEPEPQPEPPLEPEPQPEPPLEPELDPDESAQPEPKPEPEPEPDASFDSAPEPNAAAEREPQLASEAVPAAAPTVTEKSFLHYLGLSISAAVLVLVAALAAVVIVIPFVVGGQALTVLTQSMEPGLPPGTMIVIRPQSVDDIRVGDVLTYQIKSGEAAVVSHRVTSKAVGSDGSTTFLTKGDNNDLADPDPVQEVQIKGTLWYSVPWLGYVNNAVNGEARGVVVPVAAGLLFLYALWMFVSAVRDRRKKKTAGSVGA